MILGHEFTNKFKMITKHICLIKARKQVGSMPMLQTILIKVKEKQKYQEMRKLNRITY